MGTDCYPSLTRHHPPARREETEFNEFGYKIGYIHAVRRVKRTSQFLGAWDDFSFRDDQWVDEEDVKPRSKITKFYGLTASISILDRPLSLLRDGLARRMLSKVVGERRPVWEHRVEFPGLSLVKVVRPLLEWLRRPRSGKPAQIIDLDALPKGAWQLPDAVAFGGAQISIPRDAWPTEVGARGEGPGGPCGCCRRLESSRESHTLCNMQVDVKCDGQYGFHAINIIRE